MHGQVRCHASCLPENCQTHVGTWETIHAFAFVLSYSAVLETTALRQAMRHAAALNGRPFNLQLLVCTFFVRFRSSAGFYW